MMEEEDGLRVAKYASCVLKLADARLSDEHY